MLLLSNNVLIGNNFAALKGDLTVDPIYTLNNIIKDVRDKKKEFWIAFQDMTKAFDSVELIPLKFALNRIKVPRSLTNLIINTFSNKNIQIITAFGNSLGFTARDGI